jgi:peptidoglycan-N-acetylglucosamine deacetylase
MLDAWLGPCVRTLPPHPDGISRIYLTFDDGPDPDVTEKVLTLLDRYRAHATFFVVAEKARRYASLVGTLQAQGHTIGNHSLDHRFRYFFSSQSKMRDWIVRAEETLSSVTGKRSVGFRSPAGVRTPPLRACLKELGLPLIHWKIRFYDTVRIWTKEKALGSYLRTEPGDIILLHDTQRGIRQGIFLATLESYLSEGTRRLFQFDAIVPSDVIT